jgi:hypothetical protein
MIRRKLSAVESFLVVGNTSIVPLPDVHHNSAPDSRLLRWLAFLRKREVSPIDALALIPPTAQNALPSRRQGVLLSWFRLLLQ